MSAALGLLRQHLIDPETCIRCNTCEETCPVKAITHDSRNYVVDPNVCNSCLSCIAPCPTGAIDNWRSVVAAEAHSPEQQLTWDVLPGESAVGPALPVDRGARLPGLDRGLRRRELLPVRAGQPGGRGGVRVRDLRAPVRVTVTSDERWLLAAAPSPPAAHGIRVSRV